MAWRIEYEGTTLDESQVTAAHLSVVADIMGGDSWDNANPMQSPRVLAAWVALVVAMHTKQPLDLAVAYVTSRPISDLVKAVHTIDDPPLRAVPDSEAG